VSGTLLEEMGRAEIEEVHFPLSSGEQLIITGSLLVLFQNSVFHEAVTHSFSLL
jgi:hypothetical protein